MGNTQHTHFVRSLNGLNGKSQPRRIRIKHISNDDDETDGDGDFPFATFDKNPTPVRIRFPYGYSSDYQSFCVAITNQPQLFWRSSNSNENNVVSQPRVLFLSQVKSMTRQEATLLVLKTSLHFDVEILTSSSLEAKKWIAAMVSQKHHPHGAIVFMSCNEDLSEKAKELLMGYSRPYIMGHNNIGSRRKRDVNQPPPEAEFGVSFGYAECRNAGKSSANEDTAVYHCGMFPLCRTPYTLFAIFDGHGGWGVSCFAQRHFVRIFESVTKHHLDTLARYNLSSNSTFSSSSSSSSSFSSSSWETTKSQLGAILNESVVQLDNAIEGEKKIELSGSTVLVLLRAKGRIWIACSGDSAAVACTTATTNTTKDDEDVRGAMLHTQHTVENERQRLQWIAAMKPDLLRGCFSRRIFEPPKGIIKFHGSWRPSRDDIGSRVLHWDYHLTSAPMPTTIFKEDVVVVTEGSSRHRNETGSFRTKAPMLSGSGNYMRLLGLLGCARGVGDFGTVASCRSVPVKPFLSSRPDVKMFDFDGDSETYIVLASDGVWDSMTPQQVADIVFRNIEEYRLLFDAKHQNKKTRRVSSKSMQTAARASSIRRKSSKRCSIRLQQQHQQQKKKTPPPIPPPLSRRSRKQRYGMNMLKTKFQDGPLMAAAGEILRTATSLSRSRIVRPSVDDLTCFVIPACRSSDQFMVRYEQQLKSKKQQHLKEVVEEDSIETCVRKLIRLGNVSFGTRYLDQIAHTCCRAERLETARYLYTRFGYLYQPFTKSQLAVYPISLPGFVPPTIRGGRLERLKQTIKIWSEHSRNSRNRVFLGALRVSPLEFHVWQDVQRCFTFIAGTEFEADAVFERLTHHGYTLDIRQFYTMVATPSPSSSPSLNMPSNRPRQRTPLWAAVAFGSLDSPFAMNDKNSSSSRRIMTPTITNKNTPTTRREKSSNVPPSSPITLVVAKSSPDLVI